MRKTRIKNITPTNKTIDYICLEAKILIICFKEDHLVIKKCLILDQICA